jgi:hypothetical protein
VQGRKITFFPLIKNIFESGSIDLFKTILFCNSCERPQQFQLDWHSGKGVYLDGHFIPINSACIIYLFIVSRVSVSANLEPGVACIHCSSYTKVKKGLTLCSVIAGSVCNFDIKEINIFI